MRMRSCAAHLFALASGMKKKNIQNNETKKMADPSPPSRPAQLPRKTQQQIEKNLKVRSNQLQRLRAVKSENPQLRTKLLQTMAVLMNDQQADASLIGATLSENSTRGGSHLPELPFLESEMIEPSLLPAGVTGQVVDPDFDIQEHHKTLYFFVLSLFFPKDGVPSSVLLSFCVDGVLRRVRALLYTIADDMPLESFLDKVFSWDDFGFSVTWAVQRNCKRNPLVFPSWGEGELVYIFLNEGRDKLCVWQRLSWFLLLHISLDQKLNAYLCPSPNSCQELLARYLTSAFDLFTIKRA